MKRFAGWHHTPLVLRIASIAASLAVWEVAARWFIDPQVCQPAVPGCGGAAAPVGKPAGRGGDPLVLPGTRRRVRDRVRPRYARRFARRFEPAQLSQRVSDRPLHHAVSVQFDPTNLFGLISVLAVLAIVLNELVRRLEIHFSRWRSD